VDLMKPDATRMGISAFRKEYSRMPSQSDCGRIYDLSPVKLIIRNGMHIDTSHWAVRKLLRGGKPACFLALCSAEVAG
jgi:hypothetical protein